MGIMKFIPLLLCCGAGITTTLGQGTPTARQSKDITAVVDNYSEAREKRDTLLLKSILATDVDQLVSSGEWRNGVSESVKGMLSSSQNSPGKRVLTVEKIKMITPTSAIADARYEIHNSDGTVRKMWSTFVMVDTKGSWKISAIRNMLPSQ